MKPYNIGFEMTNATGKLQQ